MRERVLAFTVPDDPKWTRQSIVQLFAKQVAEAVQRMDYVSKLCYHFVEIFALYVIRLLTQ